MNVIYEPSNNHHSIPAPPRPQVQRSYANVRSGSRRWAGATASGSFQRAEVTEISGKAALDIKAP